MSGSGIRGGTIGLIFALQNYTIISKITEIFSQKINPWKNDLNWS